MLSKDVAMVHVLDDESGVHLKVLAFLSFEFNKRFKHFFLELFGPLLLQSLVVNLHLSLDFYDASKLKPHLILRLHQSVSPLQILAPLIILLTRLCLARIHDRFGLSVHHDLGATHYVELLVLFELEWGEDTADDVL